MSDSERIYDDRNWWQRLTQPDPRVNASRFKQRHPNWFREGLGKGRQDRGTAQPAQKSGR